jgi:hypothetical protein
MHLQIVEGEYAGCNRSTTLMYLLLACLNAAFAIAIAVPLLLNVRRHGVVALFVPTRMFALAFAIVFPALSMIILLSPESFKYRYSTGYDTSAWYRLFVYTAMFFSGFLVTSIATGRRQSPAKALSCAASQYVPLTRAGWAMLVILFGIVPLAAATHAMNQAMSMDYAEYLADRTALRQGMGYILTPIAWMQCLILVCYVDFLQRKKWVSFLGALLFFIVYGGITLYLGSRSRGLVLVLFAVMLHALYRARRRRLTLKRLIVYIALAGAVLGTGLLLGDIRESIVRRVARDDVGQSRVEFTTVVAAFNGFGGLENTLWLVANVGADDIIWGRSFAAVATGLVPRAIWADKYLGGGPHLRNLMNPGSYDLQTGRNLTSYSPGIVSEAFMNFYYPGGLIVGASWGLFVAWFGTTFRQCKNPLMVVLWVILMYKFAYIVTGEVFNTFASAFQLIAGVGIFFMVCRAVGIQPFQAPTTFQTVSRRINSGATRLRSAGVRASQTCLKTNLITSGLYSRRVKRTMAHAIDGTCADE